jgi:hypothetical protein
MATNIAVLVMPSPPTPATDRVISLATMPPTPLESPDSASRTTRFPYRACIDVWVLDAGDPLCSEDRLAPCEVADALLSSFSSRRADNAALVSVRCAESARPTPPPRLDICHSKKKQEKKREALAE